MNIPYIEKYMEDLTGVAKTNLVDMEPFVIRGDGRDTVKTAQEGLFYIDSVKVYDKDKNELKKWWDYRPIYIFPEATKYTGKDVTGFIQILNPELEVGGYMTYQVVGGRWSYVSQQLIDLLWAAISDTRNVFYDNILNKPSLFPPSYHTHDIKRTVGWEQRIALVEQVIDSIIVKADDVRAEYLLKHVDVIREYVDARYDEIVGWLSDHKDNSHAHGETAATVGITKLPNLATATTQDAVDGKRIDVRLTVGGMKSLVNDQAVTGSDKYIHNGMLPITQYGSLLYTEPSVRDTYEGSSQWGVQDARVMMEERDGTLVRLRPGTNGTSAGVYYDHMLNPFSDPNANFVRTNTEYWPAGLGIWKPLTIRKSDTDVIWGVVYDSTQFPTLVTKGFVSITNGTFDQSKHVSALFDLSYNHPQFGIRTLPPHAHMTIVGDYVYCFDIQNWGGSSPVGFVVLRAPVVNIVNGVTVVFEVMNGFTSTGGPFGPVSGAGAYITPKTVTNVNNDTAMFHLDNGVSLSYPHASWKWFIEKVDSNNIRLVVGGTLWIPSTSGAVDTHVGWRCTVNLTTKQVVWVDSPQPIRVTLNASNIPVMAPNAATNITQAKMSLDDGSYGNEYGVSYISQRTGMFLKSRSSAFRNLGNALVFGKIENWVPGGSNWDIANRVLSITRVTSDRTEFGSAVYNNLRGPVGLPNGFVNIVNNDEDNNPTATCVKYTGNENYPYKVVNTGVVNGYGPTSDRRVVDRVMYHRYISYWNGSALSVKGGILTPYMSGTTSDVGGDGSLVDDTQVRWVVSEINTAALNFANTLPIAPNVISAKCDIMLHPDPTVPAMAIVIIAHRTSATTMDASVYVTKVNYTGSRTGDVTGYTLSTTGYLSFNYGITSVIGTMDSSSSQPGCCVYRAGNYLLMSLAASTTVGVVGGQTAIGCNLVYDLNTGLLELAGWPTLNPYVGTVGYWMTILEGVGLAVADTDVGTSSTGTVLVMLPVGNTRDDFKAFNYADKSRRFVLVAQEVAKGGMVYFTESQPVIMNGREGVAPAMSIDLNDIVENPFNRTFYVYVIDDNGTFTHQISAESLPVTNTRVFIGTLVTDSTSIDYTTVSKKTRIGIYQLSTEKVGSSIPVSSGPYTGLGDWVIENI